MSTSGPTRSGRRTASSVTTWQPIEFATNAGRSRPAASSQSGERGGEAGNAERRGRPLTAPVPGQVRCEHREGGGERLREREHVRARDAVPVQEHDGRSLPDHARMELSPETSNDRLSISIVPTRPAVAAAATSSQTGDAGSRAVYCIGSGSWGSFASMFLCIDRNGKTRDHRLSPRLLRRSRACGRDRRTRARDLRAARLRPQTDRPQHPCRPRSRSARRDLRRIDSRCPEGTEGSYSPRTASHPRSTARPPTARPGHDRRNVSTRQRRCTSRCAASPTPGTA